MNLRKESCCKKLAKLLLAMTEGEKKIEKRRIFLAKDPNYDAYRAFNLININKKNSIPIEDLKSFLFKSKVIFKNEEINYLMNEFCTSSYLGITYSDFINLTLPKTDLELRNMNLQKKILPLHKSKNIEFLLPYLFDEIIKTIREVIYKQTDLLYSPGFSIFELFKKLDKNLTNISFEGIFEFMKSQNIQISPEDIYLILRKFDRNYDNMLDYKEFCNVIFGFGTFLPKKLILSDQISFTQNSIESRDYSPVKTSIHVDKNSDYSQRLNELRAKYSYIKNNMSSPENITKKAIILEDAIKQSQEFKKANLTLKQLKEGIFMRIEDALSNLCRINSMISINDEKINKNKDFPLQLNSIQVLKNKNKEITTIVEDFNSNEYANNLRKTAAQVETNFVDYNLNHPEVYDKSSIYLYGIVEASENNINSKAIQT